MRMSFRIARIAGIDLNLHITFLLMLPLGALIWGNGSLFGALFGVLMMILLFSSVLLHELGHALTARALGIPVREIQLLPIGGVAVLGRPVQRPGHELLITIMGPIVNLLIVFGLLIVAIFSGLATRMTAESMVNMVGTPSFDGMVLWLIQANLLLALFNMIPAFPLDGGRVLRSVMAMLMDYRRATRIAGAIGQGIAILLAVVGVMSVNFLLIAVAVFIFLGARQEVVATDVIGVLDDLSIADALNREPASLQIGQRVSDAAALMDATRQQALVVLQGERVLGIVLRADIQAAIATGRGEMWITMIMRREIVRVPFGESLEVARATMAEHSTPVLAAYDGEEFRGLLTIDDIATAYAVRDRGTPPQGPSTTPRTTPSA